MKKAEIAGAQKRPFAGGRAGGKGTGAHFRLLPISLGDTGAAHPDFPHFITGATLPGVRMDNPYLLLQDRPATTDQVKGAFRICCRAQMRIW